MHTFRLPSTSLPIFLALSLSSAATTLAGIVGNSHGPQAPIVVDSSSDLVATDGVCTLREAIDNVNAGTDTTGGDCKVASEITFAQTTDGVPIVLAGEPLDDANTTGDLDVMASVTILGNGTGQTIISGGGTDRVFDVLTGVPSVTFEDLTIRDGLADEPGEDGGGIQAGATSNTFRGCHFENNAADDNGGALTNRGNVLFEVEGCRFVGNRGEDGGALGGTGGSAALQVFVYDSIFEDNEASSEGGAIFRSDASGSLEIRRSIFRANRALTSGSNDGGGAVTVGSSNGQLTLADSHFLDNEAIDGWGGALQLRSSVSATISGTSFVDNRATDGGGGIDIRNTSTRIENSTLAGNRTDGDGGGLRIDRSSLALELSHLTITGNVADAEVDGMGDGGGLLVEEVATLTMDDTILSDNTDSGGQADDCAIDMPFQLDSLGFNLVGTTTGCEIVLLASDLLGVAPVLAPLDDYGCLAPLLDGSCPPTHPLDLASPTVDQGSCAVSGVATDQRGLARPVDISGVADAADGCDIGAYEARDEDTDGVEDGVDNCPAGANPDQADGDADGNGDACDLCEGDDATGDSDIDGICADRDCDDNDGLGISCALLIDGFESGDTSAWSSTEP